MWILGHDIDYFYSLHPKISPNKSTNYKDGEGKGGHGGGNGSQGKGKTTSILLHKSSWKTNDQGQSGGMAIT